VVTRAGHSQTDSVVTFVSHVIVFGSDVADVTVVEGADVGHTGNSASFRSRQIP
jgi:hypothetical protein